MAKKELEKAQEAFEEKPEPVNDRILPIEVEFGNGDMNLLRDKINEVIKRG